jgi:[ribosomal protein S5]-alanine N-acetyltransferase
VIDPTIDVIVSDRLMLPLLTASRLERILGGDLTSVGEEIGLQLPTWWVSESGRHMRFRLGQIHAHPEVEPWLIRPIALRTEPAQAIGIINFHGPPDERGFAEVGYSLQPEYRGQGYAIEAVRALFGWAAAEHSVSRFRASIAPDNARSLNLVTKVGMTRVGAQWDEEDGLELIYALEGWGTA